MAWYGLGAAAALAALRHGAFVPGPGARPRGPPAAAAAAPAAAAAAAVAELVGGPEGAWAKGGAYGPLEGKASSLVHPLVEAVLFLTVLYAGYLGWQWRQVRLIGVEIQDLRKQIPKDEVVDDEHPPSPAHLELKGKIDELTKDRTALIKGQYKDRHFQISSLLLGSGLFFTTYGVFNTWFRTEKLFPGPHLFAGAAICTLWALAAACVPWMEKGNETARTAHISLNVIMVGLFLWQLPTGFEILMKVWGNNNLPWF